MTNKLGYSSTIDFANMGVAKTCHDSIKMMVHIVLLVLSREWIGLGEWDDYY